MAVDFKLYLITDRKIMKSPLVDAVKLALAGGIKAVQLREKDLPVRELLDLAKDLRRITREFGAKLFVNDRVDVAVAVGADGVHLGGQSIPCHAVRNVVGDDMLIGVSTHNLEEARQAEASGADFITFGPVFDTPSKRAFGAPVGLDELGRTVRKVSIPVFALGGIALGSIDEVLARGAQGVAMISAIFASDNIRKAAEDVVGAIKGVYAGEHRVQHRGEA